MTRVAVQVRLVHALNVAVARVFGKRVRGVDERGDVRPILHLNHVRVIDDQNFDRAQEIRGGFFIL